MTLGDYIALSDKEKSNYLWENGEPVAGNTLHNARFILYHLDSFYVEAEYKTDFNEIVAIKAYDVNDLPEEYWSDTDVSSLNL